VAGALAWIGLGAAYGWIGAAAGAPIAVACFMLGRARSKPWRCGHCKTPLATAQVRVCPGCGARLVDLGVGKVVRRRASRCSANRFATPLEVIREHLFGEEDCQALRSLRIIAAPSPADFF